MEIKKEKERNYNIDSEHTDEESATNSPIMLTVPSDVETIMDENANDVTGK